MRSILTTLGEVAGGGLIATGCLLAWTPLGFIVGGALLIGGSWFASAPADVGDDG